MILHRSDHKKQSLLSKYCSKGVTTVFAGSFSLKHYQKKRSIQIIKVKERCQCYKNDP